jgi:hypothetical protein
MDALTSVAPQLESLTLKIAVQTNYDDLSPVIGEAVQQSVHEALPRLSAVLTRLRHLDIARIPEQSSYPAF